MCTIDRKENIDSVLQREYTVENVLGTGGFGTVYSGIRKQDSKAVSWFELAINEYYVMKLRFYMSKFVIFGKKYYNLLFYSIDCLI